jgi:cytochrome c oxidase assembly protein subunit 15
VARPAIRLASGEQVLMTRLLCVAAALVIVLGTVVTSSGPHGGDPKAKRFSFSVHDVARLHSSAVWLFLALTAVTLWSLQRSRSPASVMRRGELLLAVIVAQGVIGYVQYFTGVPAGLVVVHIAVAALLWAVTLRFALGMFRWPAPAGSVPVTGASRRPSDPVLTSGWNG